MELVILQFVDSLREDFLICLISQIFHKSRLLCTQQVACSANVQILHCQRESATKVCKGLKSLQTPAALCRKICQRWSEEIAESLPVATSHTATHLVEVAEAEVVCIINDDGVGIRDVDTIFYYGGGEENVVLVVYETHYNFL